MTSKKYNYVLINMIMTGIIFLVALNSVSSHFGFNGLQKLDKTLGFNISNFIFIITGVSIILLSIKKYTWLPFLGEMVLPATLINETKNIGDTSIKIKIKPNTKVAYWSSLPLNEEKPSVEKAYGDYSNAGVSKSDNNGFVTLTFNKGTGYVVPSGRFIKPHIHYRVLNEEWSMIGPVKTIFL
jgi:hypothetical protein